LLKAARLDPVFIRFFYSIIRPAQGHFQAAATR